MINKIFKFIKKFFEKTQSQNIKEMLKENNKNKIKIKIKK